MTVTNDFLDFCPTDTGTNLLSESDYAADADRTSGNKPGAARSKLVNKALRQANAITKGISQYLSDTTNTSLTDDNTPAKLLAQINAALTVLPPVITKYTSGSGTFNQTSIFFVTAANATVGATYTNNSVTFTVVATIAGAVRLVATGPGFATSSGTLTKATGTGDATITFNAVRSAVSMRVVAVGGGGGGAGSGTSDGSASGNGTATTFGTSLLSAGGGTGGLRNSNGGAGGAVSLGSGPIGIGVVGGMGGSPGVQGGSVATAAIPGGSGGSSALGGSGAGGCRATNTGLAAAVNSGGGGGGGLADIGVVNSAGGAGGGAGAFIDAVLTTLIGAYAYVVGALGAHGGGGGSGFAGGDGGSGILIIQENFQ